MRVKEFLLGIIRTYFAVVALVCVANAIMGPILAPQQTFGYEAFLSPLLIGLAGTLPAFVMYSRREMSVKELLVRKAVQLVLIEALVLFVMFWGSSGSHLNPKIVLSVALSVVIIYVIIDVVEILQDRLAAKTMTEELAALQQRVGEKQNPEE